MNRKEFAEALAGKTETSKAEADRTIGAVIEIISGALKKGDSVSLVGFGSFEVRKLVLVVTQRQVRNSRSRHPRYQHSRLVQRSRQQLTA